MSLNPVSQTVTIDGNTFKVYGSSIDLRLSSIPRISFTFDVDANAALPFVSIGEPIVLNQTCDGVQTFSGRVSSVKAQRGNNFTRFIIEAFGIADAAKFRRHYLTFPRQNSVDLLNSVWGPVGVSVVAASGAPMVEEYGATYDSTFDVTNYIVNSTGWHWTLDNYTLNFFDPTENAVSKSIVMSDFEKGTLSTNHSSDALFNIARMQAYEYRTVDFTDPNVYEILPTIRYRAGTGVGAPWVTIRPTYCTRDFSRPRNTLWGRNRVDDMPLSDWEFVDAEALRFVPAEGWGTVTADEVEFTFDSDTGILTTNIDMLAAISLFKATFRRLVWIEVQRQESIDAYGVREAPTLTSNTGMGIDEGLQLLGEYLDQRAAPTLVVTGNYLYSNLSCGERVTLTLPELNASGDYIVTAVKRSISGDDLQLNAEFRKIAPASSGRPARIAAKANPDMAPEIFKRLNRLETAKVDPRSNMGQILVERGPIQGKATFGAAIEINGGFTYQTLTEGIGFDEGEI